METKIFNDDLREAVDIILGGGLVAVPTETVYGLAANGFDEKAVKRIFKVKGRPSDRPLSLMVEGESAMDELCLDVPEQARFLAKMYWPGPLTIVLKAKSNIPEIVIAGGTTVGLRCPDQKDTLELLQMTKCPLAAPSANPFSEPSPKSARQVRNYFDGKIEGIIDGGICDIGTESTIIDMSKTPYTVLREGALQKTEIYMMLLGNMDIVGLTGGSGSGKTTALEAICELGGLVIDCDEVYHDILETDENMLKELKMQFPEVFKNGKMDRKALGKRVFSNEKELKILNGITHRYVGQAVRKRLMDFGREGGKFAAIDAIELFDSGISSMCKANIAVCADENYRIKRLVSREGISEEYAKMRIKAQHSDEYFKSKSDYVLINNKGREEFKDQCKELFKAILRR